MNDNEFCLVIIIVILALVGKTNEKGAKSASVIAGVTTTIGNPYIYNITNFYKLFNYLLKQKV